MTAPKHDDPGMIIPAERLPPGFAQRVGEHTSNPAVPAPAATGVLMRDGANGIELLLMKRHRASGFVPGAYVFAGGRVDDGDADARLAALTRNVPKEPSPDYWFATIREVFEETGVLLARTHDGNNLPSASNDAEMERLRESLMSDHATLLDVLGAVSAMPDLDSLAYAAHWITPVAETRRYDTRFFYAKMPDNAEVRADPREMSDAIWLSPEQAIARFQSGTLPMVFPTIRTINDLLKYKNVDDAMVGARATDVKPILPTLVRVGDGVGIVLDEEDNRD